MFENLKFMGDFNDFNDFQTIRNIRRYLTTNKAYGESGHRDTHLQKSNVEIGGCRGTLHFIRFPTSQMSAFIRIAKEKGMAKLSSTVCATGGKSSAIFTKNIIL